MEITVSIAYEQLLATIKKLPAAKIKQLKSVLDDGFIEEKAEAELSDFQNFLMNGPVMTSDQYDLYKQNRQQAFGFSVV